MQEFLARLVREGGEFCRSCGAANEHREVYVSLHASEFGICAGPGAVLRIMLPYCPKCEREDTRTVFANEIRGCIHAPGLL